MDNITVNYPKYPKYKDSGVKWLGEIPEHWSVNPGIKFFKENKRSNQGMKEKQVLSLSYGEIIVKPKDKLFGLIPESFETYQIVYPNDIIVRCTDLQNDQTSLRFGLSKDKGIITSAYINLGAEEKYNSKFYYYFFHFIDITKVLYKFGSGLRQNLSFNDFKRMPVLDIPIDEQNAIVKFIDSKCAKIDEAISNKEKMIDLLKTRKQIIIQNAVTRGLDPDVPLKDSGIDWLGKIPQHWEVKRFGAILEPFSKKNFPDLPLLSITRENGIIERNIESKEENHNFIPDDLSNYKLLQKGQFGMNKMKAWQGSYGISQYTGIVSPAYFIFNLDSNIFPDFFHVAVRSKYYVSLFACSSDGVRIGQWDLSKDRMKKIKFILPPLDEQKVIVSYIKEEIKKINKAIDLQEKQIDKLKEYKSVLIDSAVTGKIKVI